MQDTNIESLEGEIWKDIPGYEGYYQASNIGRVKSIERYVKNGNGSRIVRSKILDGYTDKFGYLVYNIQNGKGSIKIRGHRIMGITFLGLTTSREFDPSISLCVCHKDDNPSNNRLDNLYLGTLSDNSKDRHKKGRTKPPINHVHMFGKDNHITKVVIQFNKDFEYVAKYYGSGEAGRATGIQPGNIRACCRGRVQTAGGYIWRYEDSLLI